MDKHSFSKTKQEEYFDEGRNSTVYYLAPKTNDIYLYSKQQEKFNPESLNLSKISFNSSSTPGLPQSNYKIPSYYSTIQRVENDAIYIIGGLAPPVQIDDYNLLSTCLQMDNNL